MPRPDPISQGTSPADALSRWRPDEPVALLASGGGSPRARWSILARPTATIVTPALADLLRVNSDLATLEPAFRGVGGGVGGGAGRLVASGHMRPDAAPPFVSGWIGWISYALGAVLEPAVGHFRRSDWPLMVWHRCEGALVHDAANGRWHCVGNAPTARLLPASEPNDDLGQPALQGSLAGGPPERYQAMVARGIEYVRAGDVYQVNLAHTLDGRLAPPPRRFSASLLDRTTPWFGAHVEHVGPDGRGRAVCSASPESFLEIDAVGAGAARRIVTRPMKGTLSGDRSPAALERSSKDRAELDMIVDLMRNDLGRVAETGSVHVRERRAIERHGATAAIGAPGIGTGETGHASATGTGVWQGVATVEGVLRPRVTLAELLKAVFPAGSITGAPKIRAMQIIEQLEDRPRGPYCGCVGFIGDDGRVALNVAIRTALVEEASPGDPPLVSYSVGAGIVADSDPASEWRETMDKARGFLDLTTRRSDGAGGYVISEAC